MHAQVKLLSYFVDWVDPGQHARAVAAAVSSAATHSSN
jgi:hypothetical protein